jgi:hypothetical protein
MQNSTEDANGWAHQEILLSNYKYKINDTMVNKQDLMVFNKNMFNSNYKSKDIRLYKWTPALNITYSSTFNVDYALFFDKLYIEDISTLKTYGLIPSFNYAYNKTNIIKGSLKYQKKLNQKLEEKSKDSIVTELSTTLTNIYSNQFIHNSTFTYTKEKKENGKQKGVDKTDLDFKLSSTYIYKPNITFSTSISYKQTKYKDVDNAYLVKKENKLYDLGFSNTYAYSPKLLIQTNLNLINQKSNIPTDKYNKQTFGINIIRSF